MKRPPSEYSNDGRWWWDGEQWQEVDPRNLPVPADPARDIVRRWSLPRPRPPGRSQLVAMAITAMVIALAIGVPPPAAMPWLPAPPLPSHSLPTVRLPSPHLPSLHLPPIRLPSLRVPGSAPHTPPPSASPTPRPPSAEERYRADASAGGAQIASRMDDVDRGCTAPANLAVCRSALLALQDTDGRLRGQLDGVGTPACLGGPDAELRKALNDVDAAAGDAVAGIDGQDPNRIVAGVQTVDQNRAALTTALDHVHTAPC